MMKPLYEFDKATGKAVPTGEYYDSNKGEFLRYFFVIENGELKAYEAKMWHIRI